MKESFRQSMVWLHSWLGLTAGWILYFVFLTGTTGYLHFEISRWMRPELPLVSGITAPAETLTAAQRYLSEHAAGADFWVISFPGHRGSEELAVSWRSQRSASMGGGDVVQATLNPLTGERVERRPRSTGGGTTLYIMHYALHYISRDKGTLIVGAAAMTMLVAILSGIVAHKKIFSAFFTFRPAAGHTGWRSVHTLLGAAALPFFLMMTWSGLIFFLFLYMPAAQRALFPDDDAMMRFNVEAYFPQDGRTHEGPASPASSASLPEVVAQAERLWGAGSVLSLRIENPGRANARVTAFTRRAEIAGETRTAFDAATGAPLPVAARRTAPSKFYSAILGLHEGHFAWSYLRMLYVLGGLAGTALVGTGLVQWSVKRRPKPDERTSRHLGMAVVDVLNLGTIVGLPIGIGAYFWANRLLPLDLAGRADWEAHVMFIAWAAIYLYAAVRPQNRAWPEVCALAAMIYGLIPVLNALTTDRHLGVTIPAGDWVLAGFDLSALAAGVFFAVVARTIWRKQRPHGAARVIETAPVGKPEMA